MVVASLPEPLRGDRQHVLLDGEVVGVGIDARQVDVDDEAVAITVGVERHGRSPEALARRDEAVELTERIEPHKHLERTSWWSSSGTPSRSEEHTSELQSLMRISYAVFFLKKKKTNIQSTIQH